MPNYCENDIYIYGTPAQRQAFVDGIKPEGERNRISFLHSYFPCPTELMETQSVMYPPNLKLNKEQKAEIKRLKDNRKKFGFASWYDWCQANWGTKWGDTDLKIIPQKSATKLACRSAWAPPKEGLLHVSKRFPDLRFVMKFYEMGMGFKGVYAVQNGEVLEESSDKYNGNRGG